MPKKARELSALEVTRLKEDGDHHVGGVDGLILRVNGASRVWVLRVRVGEGRRNLGLGPFPTVSLGQAREKARERRAQILNGDIDMLTARQVRHRAAQDRAKIMTVREAGQALIESMRPGWKNAVHAEQWTSTLQTYVYPKIGDLSVPEVSAQLVLQVLQPIWYEKPETASRVRGRLEALIDYYAAVNHVQVHNPARWKGHLDKLLPHKSKIKKVKHHAAVPWKDAPKVAEVIAGRKGVAAKALQAVILTVVRYSEASGMRAGEILWDERIWVVPADRVKGDLASGRDNYVPLSDQMLELLRSVGADKMPADAMVFGSSQKQRAGEELSENSLTKVMKNAGIDATTHGWRSTFKDWAAESTAYPNELSEMQLAHVIANKAEAAYRRGDMLEKRRPMMQEWADYVMPKKKPAEAG